MSHGEALVGHAGQRPPRAGRGRVQYGVSRQHDSPGMGPRSDTCVFFFIFLKLNGNARESLAAKNVSERRRGRVESKRQRAESQRIVAARPLCRLQYPVAYLSRLQRILPAARWKLSSGRPTRLFRREGLAHDTCPWGPNGPYCGSASGRRAHASLLAGILT